MPSPLYKSTAAKSKIAKSKDGIVVCQGGDSTTISIKPAVGLLGDSPAIVLDLMMAVDSVLNHWGK